MQVQSAGSAGVTAFSKDEARKQRPHGLNTVALLKVASSSLNIGPQRAMQVHLAYLYSFFYFRRSWASTSLLHVLFSQTHGHGSNLISCCRSQDPSASLVYISSLAVPAVPCGTCTTVDAVASTCGCCS